MTEPYAEDLACVHGAGFGDFARDAAPGLLRMFHEHGIDGGRVVDLGCGSGIWAAELVNAGYEVVGVDLSAAMIDIACRRAPDAEFRLGSFLDHPLPKCRAVTALGEVLNYRFDRRNTRTALHRLFRHVYSALEPGGLLICDVAGPGRHRGTSRRFFEGRDWTTLVEFHRDERRNRLTRRIVTFRRVGETWRRSEETHPLQLYPPSEIAGLLRSAGFRVRTTQRYGDMPLLPDLTGFIARRPLVQNR
jgi:SAM-dependent methyltransferase